MREFINFFAKVSNNIPAHSARGAVHCVIHPHFGAMSHTHRSENKTPQRGRFPLRHLLKKRRIVKRP
jgi:hypothetical protein